MVEIVSNNNSSVILKLSTIRVDLFQIFFSNNNISGSIASRNINICLHVIARNLTMECYFVILLAETVDFVTKL